MAAKSLCSIPNCDKPAKNAGLCWMHYCRVRRHGDPNTVKKPANGKVREYFQNVVLTHEGDECFFWPHGVDQHGYGRIHHNNRMYPVHRLVCEIIEGPPPSPKHEAAHNCGNGRLGCVNKRHMRWATPAENSADKVTHGTHNRGENHYRSRLTEDDVRSIRAMEGKVDERDIAVEYNVSRGCISRIMRRGTWRHI